MCENKFVRQTRSRAELHYPFLPASQHGLFPEWPKCPRKSRAISLPCRQIYLGGIIPNVQDWAKGKSEIIIKKKNANNWGLIQLGTL